MILNKAELMLLLLDYQNKFDSILNDVKNNFGATQRWRVVAKRTPP